MNFEEGFLSLVRVNFEEGFLSLVQVNFEEGFLSLVREKEVLCSLVRANSRKIFYVTGSSEL